MNNAIANIDKEIAKLQTMRRELEEQEREQHKEQARKFVGKCYRSRKGNVIKIIGIPRTYLYMRGIEYDKYQFPAIFLNYPDVLQEAITGDDCLYNFSPICCDTVRLDIDKGIPNSWDVVYDEEITEQEFNVEFDKCIKSFKEKINV